MLTTIVTVLILGSVFSFFVLLSVEVYKSFRDASLHDEQRKSEADRVEATLLQQSRGGSSRFHARDPAIVTAADCPQPVQLQAAASLRSGDRTQAGDGAVRRGIQAGASAGLGVYAHLPVRLPTPLQQAQSVGSSGTVASAARRPGAIRGRVAVGRQMRSAGRRDASEAGARARASSTAEDPDDSCA
jgi:hypothetical protein